MTGNKVLSEHITREDAERIMFDFRGKLIREGKYPDFSHSYSRQLELIAYAYECGRNDERAEQ